MQGRLQIIHNSSLQNSSEKAVRKGDEHGRVEVLTMGVAIAYHRSRLLSSAQIWTLAAAANARPPTFAPQAQTWFHANSCYLPATCRGGKISEV